MQVVGSDGTPLRGDLITRVALRTDLVPIPSTVEITAIQTRETLAALAEGLTVNVGGTQQDYLLVKVGAGRGQRVMRGDREAATITAVGILASCAAVGGRLQRSIIREGSNFAEIYRSIGAAAVIGSDFAVPQFSAFIGMLPTPEIARVLQEEAAVVMLQGGKLHFRRLADLMSEKAAIEFPEDRTDETKADFLERHSVPFAFTTTADNALLATKREAARGIAYRPRGNARVLNNISSALIQRRTMRESLSPELNAGARIDVGGRPHVVITAAHLREQAVFGGEGAEYTQLWLGEFQQ